MCVMDTERPAWDPVYKVTLMACTQSVRGPASAGLHVVGVFRQNWWRSVGEGMVQECQGGNGRGAYGGVVQGSGPSSRAEGVRASFVSV